MRAATKLDLTTKVEGDRVFIDGKRVECTKTVVTIPTGGGPVTVWLAKGSEADDSTRAVMETPGNPPVALSLTPTAVDMFTRTSRHTVVDWMCRAAEIEL
jgi:hypothetical protein